MADYTSSLLGLISNAINSGVDWMQDPRRTQQMQMLGGLLADSGAKAAQHRGLMGQEVTYATSALKKGNVAEALRGGPAGEQLTQAVANAYNPAGITVYHGSPYRFSRFDPTKIGSGEGAQAYGYGHYVAESPDVARSYQSALSADRGFSFEGKSGLTRAQIQEMVDKKYGPGYLDNVIRPSGVADSFIDDMVTGSMRGEGSYPRQYKPGSQRAKIYDELRGKITHADPGSLYTIDLPDPAVARMLDYDRPFSQQTPEVKKMLQDAGILGRDDWLISGMKGREIYNRASFGAPVKLPLRQQDDQIYASQRLREAGIPGIRYLDENSRRAGAGTSNFVVFPGEEELLRILSVNGGLLTP